MIDDRSPASKRAALLIATATYADPGLRSLRSPAIDVDQLAEVLNDPEIGNFAVRRVVDVGTDAVREELEGFFLAAGPRDVLLLYISGHGVLSRDRTLHFATSSTRIELLRSSAVPASFISEVIHDSRARTVVALLDCCHSGAFAKDLFPKSAPEVVMSEQLAGEGLIAITASSELEYAFEGTEASSYGQASTAGSFFTQAVIRGLKTGDADMDLDGEISVDDLYEYVHNRLRDVSPGQRPAKSGSTQGGILLARSRRGAVLPQSVLEPLRNEFESVRLSAIGELARYWRSDNAELAAAARSELERRLDDVSAQVASAAAAVLRAAALDPPQLEATAPVVGMQESMDAVRTAMDAATSLVHAHRTHGHLAARLDPLGFEPEGDPSLDPDSLGLTPKMMASIPTRVLRVNVPGETLAEALPHLREIYCGTTAYEIEHLSSHRERLWLRERIESRRFGPPLTTDEQLVVLRRLTQVELLERFMQETYPGEKQFSIEGLDMTVPMLDEMIQLAAANGAREVVIGMAHRGRLNVLAHCLGRAYETIFREFEGASSIEAVTTIPQGGTGDVKYHHGAQGRYELPDDSSILVRLESNPSHLEYVSPVTLGATRAIQTTRQGPHAHLDNNAAIPVILHGDAAFPGQGVVAETFNLQGLDGYTVGGSLHLIQNNQVGFTTDPDDSRSTRWASDLAKGFDVPIIHVNADDVAACVAAVRLAFVFRQEFGRDVLIDLIGYRRFGHNEADEPAYTQPGMAIRIRDKRSVRQLFASALANEGVIAHEDADELVHDHWQHLVARHQALKEAPAAEAGEPVVGDEFDRSPSPEVRTAVSTERLVSLNDDLLRVPEGFTVHPKLIEQLERRRETLGPDGGIDWAHAEALAFASLLSEGTPIRLTGQDSERGTFSQRHLVLHDAKTGQPISPIQSLPGALAPMELHNSPLSEVACLGFEYGYAMEAPETLVLWEAQFGDFVNSAQVIIDQFIVSALSKWGQSTRLTLLLPHGYEGSGPEHSSARIEDFLLRAAEGNLRIVNLTTPAQYFHMLRRQARMAKQRPLVIMTPKSLLRLPQATSRIEHLSDSRFFPVLSEPRIDEAKVSRLVLCSGKIYYDLTGHATREHNEGVAISRVELLYPFPQRQIMDEVARYPNLREVLWVQEEPRNMGARAHMSPRLRQILPSELGFGYVGRPERASPGEGYPAAHTMEQTRIIRAALDTNIPAAVSPAHPPGLR